MLHARAYVRILSVVLGRPGGWSGGGTSRRRLEVPRVGRVI